MLKTSSAMMNLHFTLPYINSYKLMMLDKLCLYKMTIIKTVQGKTLRWQIGLQLTNQNSKQAQESTARASLRVGNETRLIKFNSMPEYVYSGKREKCWVSHLAVCFFVLLIGLSHFFALIGYTLYVHEFHVPNTLYSSIMYYHLKSCIESAFSSKLSINM